MASFDSKLEIGQKVDFTPTFKQLREMGIGQEQLYGEVVAVRFTKAKVWYDVLGEYHGVVFSNIPSEKVIPSEPPIKMVNQKEEMN